MEDEQTTMDEGLESGNQTEIDEGLGDGSSDGTSNTAIFGKSGH